MTFVRNLFSDLVDKRLWPVAVALLLALVAVFVFLAKPAPQSGSRLPAPIAAAKDGVALADPAALASQPGDGPVSGRFKDPFKQQHLPKRLVATAADVATAAGDATGAAGGESESSGGSTSSGSGGGGSGDDDQPVTKLRVKFGPSTGTRRTLDVAPGTPLPTGDNPLIVYVDLGDDGKTAEFLVSADAQPQGDGLCKPNKTICAQLFLRPGETEFFDVVGPNGTVQYVLDVLKVVKS